MIDTIVIGAGISGLTAAYRLDRAGQRVLLLEASDRLGGLVASREEAGYLIELGPSSIPGGAEALRDLALRVHVGAHPASALGKRRYLYLNDNLQALPGGFRDAIGTGVLSLPGKLKLLAEPVRPKIQNDDPSVAEFFRHRIGPEAVANLVDPFVSGIYAGDVDALSMSAVFPSLWAWEQRAGSLMEGAKEARKAARRKRVLKSSRAALMNFKGGLQSVTDALGVRLPIGSVLLNSRVSRVAHARQGSKESFTVTLTNGEMFDAPNLILAVPADAAARLLRDVLPLAISPLLGIPYAGLAVTHFGFEKSAIPHPLDGFGFLVPRKENLALLGSIWASSLFPERAPAGHVLLSNYIGGAHRPEIAGWPEDRIEAQVLADLQTVFKLPEPPVPTYRRTVRYTCAIPQYVRGHCQRIALLEKAVASLPGLALCGNYLHGVALNECVKSGLAAADLIRTRE